jgi:TIR domain
MHIFLSYAAEDRDTAEQIYFALISAGHQVFFDQATLLAGGDYNARIRQALRASELLIFLISPDSVAPSSYALTELNFAREKWPHPGGAVLPVMARRTEFANIPNYLKAVTVLEPSGNATAEVAAWVASQNETSLKRSIRNIIGKRTLIGTSIFVVVIAISVSFLLNQNPVRNQQTDYAGDSQDLTSPCRGDFEKEPAKDSANVEGINLTGEWEASDDNFKQDRYPVDLRQDGPNVHGSYERSYTDMQGFKRPVRAAIAGRVMTDKLLCVRWTQPYQGGKSGTAALTISSDRKSLSGPWFYEQSKTPDGRWYFRRD